MEEPKQKTKRRLCFICRRELTVRHYIKEEWLEDLKKHCINLEMWEKISPGNTEICCSHFEEHSHSTSAANASRDNPCPQNRVLSTRIPPTKPSSTLLFKRTRDS